MRRGALRLAGRTGWAEASILGMRTSRFVWWIEGLKDGEPTP